MFILLAPQRTSVFTVFDIYGLKSKEKALKTSKAARIASTRQFIREIEVYSPNPRSPNSPNRLIVASAQ
jgi:hypothetical protein